MRNPNPTSRLLLLLVALVLLVLCSGTASATASNSGNEELLKKLQQVAGIYQDPSQAKAMGVEKAVMVTACNHGFLNHLFNFDCFIRRLGKRRSKSLNNLL